MTEIRILIYTDTKDISLTPDDPTKPPTWSVSILRDVLETSASPFLKFTVEVINRYENPPQARKIDAGMLGRFDQIWFFGKYQSRVDGEFNIKFGGEENELDVGEIQALENWMMTHGVLVAGDHSESPPNDPDAPVKDFLCLGKALGQGVPRAGDLRSWVGEPTALPVSSFNTLVMLKKKGDPDSDAVPQQYLLEPVGPSLMPHPILTGADQSDNDSPLDLFPDHIHEGEVVVPQELGDKWPPREAPEKEKPRPIVIARGCDKRHCRSRPVLALYDPPEALSAGRIVADSTWHHYLNVNVRGLRDASDQSAFFLLRQFYRHVAFFLAPAEKRREVSNSMLNWMLDHPEVWEEKGNDPALVGTVALKHLSAIATRYEIAEMLQHVILSKANTDSEAADLPVVNFPQMSAGISALPARELVVGHIVNTHYREASLRLKSGEGLADADADDVNAVAATGIEMAFRAHGRRLAEIGSVTEKYLKLLG